MRTAKAFKGKHYLLKSGDSWHVYTDSTSSMLLDSTKHLYKKSLIDLNTPLSREHYRKTRHLLVYKKDLKSITDKASLLIYIENNKERIFITP